MSKAKTSQATKSSKTAESSETKAETLNPKQQLSEIRNLLFGEQVSSLQATIKKLNDDTNARLNDLEKLINKNNTESNKQLEKLSQQIAEDLETNRLEHVSQEGILEEKLEGLSGQLDNYQQEAEKEFKQTHDLIAKNTSDMNKSLKAEVEKLPKQIEKVSSELGTNKADRKTLATLLESMATNLTESQA